MSNLLFLLAAVVVAGLGIAVLWLRSRQPRSVDSGVDDFSRRMSALAPDDPARGPRDDGPGALR